MRKEQIQKIVEGGIMLALSIVLSYIRIAKFLPWGGSVSLLSMLPVAVYSIRWGIKEGLFVSFLFSLAQLAQGFADGLAGWGLTPAMLAACIFLDYIGAYTVIGFAGIFRKNGLVGQVSGTILAVAMRFVCHIVSGAVIFHSAGKLWEGFSTNNEWLYSLIYNATYMLPEIVFTAIGAGILLSFPAIRKTIETTKDELPENPIEF